LWSIAHATSLATCDNYHFTRENDSYQLVIWNGQLRGEDFWCPSFKEDGLFAEKAGGHQVEKRSYALENKTISKPLKVHRYSSYQQG
jgi:hypothetical protein